MRPALAQDVASALFSQQTAYLIELSKYTDWDFDVIELSPEEVGDALLAGQIDLAMPMELHIHDTEHFASSRPTALRDLIGLYSRPGDDRFAAADQDLAVLESARIGLVESRPDLLAPFEKFCQDNGLSVTSVSFASDPEAHAALADGTIDLLLDAATASDEQESFVIALDSMPMAIAGLRQNSGLLGVIDDANAALEAQSPRFSELARQQFEDRTMVEDGKADLLLDIYTPNSDTTGLYYTDPVYTQEYILVGRDGAYVPKKGAIATPSLQPSFIDAVRQRFPDWTVLPTPDEQHALAAVSNGRTNLALSSVVSMQATRNLILYPNLVLVPSENRILIGTSLAIFSLSYFVTFYPLQTGLLMGGILLLICLAIFLRTTRDRDLIGRFGGDEFVIFLKNCTREAIPRIAGDLNRAATLVDERSRMTNPDAQAHPERPLITVSIGIAIAASTHETYEEIFRKADHAVYSVKENGRGNWAIYGEDKVQK